MNSILVTTNGPLECRGEVEIVGSDDALVAQHDEIWLCRCGQSANKPYCDGSHGKSGFRDPGTPEAAAPAVQPGSAGALRIRLRHNGPLKLDGRFEVHHPVAGLIFAGEETALCRCGHSSKKPFCDGTHRQIGFVA